MEQNKIMEDIHASHEADKQKLWEQSEQLEFIKEMKKGKNLEEIMRQFDLEKAFAQAPVEMGCSDGRCPGHRFGGAGNFILASDADIEKLVAENKGRIAEIKSHEGCGAAAIKFKMMKKAGQVLPEGVQTSDELGIYHSRKLAEKFGAKHSHTSKAEMLGDIHDERTIYFDGTGKFNPMALPELPEGFMCSGSALGLSDEYMETELSELSDIAFHHGFGDKFDNNNPFYLIISASSNKQLNKMKEIAEKAVKKFNGRIIVDGFVAK